MKNFFKKEAAHSQDVDTRPTEVQADAALVHDGRTTWNKVWPIFAAGSGLFSDGYLNNVSHLMLGRDSLILTGLSSSRSLVQ